MHATLIVAVELDGGDGMDAWNFICAHQLTRFPGLARIKECLTKAWKAWAKTDEGREYIGGNGTNWGDCTSIPDSFLQKFGIYSFENAHIPDGRFDYIHIRFDSKHVVDHNETFAYK